MLILKCTNVNRHRIDRLGVIVTVDRLGVLVTVDGLGVIVTVSMEMLRQ